MVPADPTAPADTDMMRIVHTALRRDLQRAQQALTRVPPPDDRQRVALARHLVWMMHFLESHHSMEDRGLYPVVRRRDPGAALLLDGMATDHEVVAEAITRLEEAATAYGDHNHDGGRETDGELLAVVDAVDHLIYVLFPHLQREEEEAMPVVSRVITAAEWRAIEHEHHLGDASMAQLGREGHWLIDDATAEDRARVLGLVPLMTRLFLLYGFGPSYRRRSRVCWNARRRRVQQLGVSAVVVDADIDAVWEVVRDPTRVGEWSHECVGCDWVDGATCAAPGARFRGRNKQGRFSWGRLCEVVTAEPYELVWRTVPTRLYPDSTRWAIRLSVDERGTRIEQTFRVVRGTKLEALYATVVPAHRDRSDALTRDLERIGAVAMRPVGQAAQGKV